MELDRHSFYGALGGVLCLQQYLALLHERSS